MTRQWGYQRQPANPLWRRIVRWALALFVILVMSGTFGRGW